MKNLVSKINGILSGFTGWLMLVMMLLLVADIIWRMAGMPLQGLAELSVFVMMIVVYLGFSRCEEYKEHVALEFITDMLPLKARRSAAILVQTLSTMTVALLFYAVVLDALSAFATKEAIEGVMELPTWPTKFFMVLGMAFFLIQAALNIFYPPEADKTDEAPSAFE